MAGMPAWGTSAPFCRRARPFSTALPMALRISRSMGASTASGWSTRSSTVTAFFPASIFATRSLGNGRNMIMSMTPTFRPFSARR